MTKPTRLHRAAVALGKRGGRAKTPAKAAAARANGRKGGRPRKLALRIVQTVQPAQDGGESSLRDSG